MVAKEIYHYGELGRAKGDNSHCGEGHARFLNATVHDK